VRNHFPQASEPIADLCCYKEQIPFYQNDNYDAGKKLQNHHERNQDTIEFKGFFLVWLIVYEQWSSGTHLS